ncbi:MAG: nuclear transport factor 2 family protein [Thermoanaerobaculia bacterium]
MNRTIVIGTVALALVAGIAIAMHHENDALIALDKEWGAAAQGQEAVDAITRIIAEDVIAMSGDGIGSRADMIAEAQSADAPTGPYKADSYEVKMITDDIAVMTHHAGDPDPHYSLHVWQKKGGKWVVVASASAPETKD